MLRMSGHVRVSVAASNSIMPPPPMHSAYKCLLTGEYSTAWRPRQSSASSIGCSAMSSFVSRSSSKMYGSAVCVAYAVLLSSGCTRSLPCPASSVRLDAFRGGGKDVITVDHVEFRASIRVCPKLISPRNCVRMNGPRPHFHAAHDFHHVSVDDSHIGIRLVRKEFV